MLNKYKAGENLILYIKVYLSFSLVILIGVLLYQIDKHELLNRKFCLSPDCLELFFTTLINFPVMIDFLLGVLVSGVSIYVVSHALIHYLNSIETSRSNVYLVHLNTFNTFLTSEVENYTRLDIKSFDVFKWYNLAFPDARNGRIQVGGNYVEFISNINSEIKTSNNIDGGKKSSVERFDYKDHQSRIIKAVNEIGTKLPRAPRNDFYEIEGDMFSLINKVNTEFCFLERDGKLFERKYI